METLTTIQLVSGVVLAVAVAYLLVRFVVGAARFCNTWIIGFVWCSNATRRNFPMAIKARLGWRWLTRNLSLAWVDKESKTKSRAAFGPTIGRDVRIHKPKERVRYPHVRIKPDDFGIIAQVKTIPRVGREEFEKGAGHIANSWRCVRVQVSQPKPGHLIVRGLRSDPLAVAFGMDGAPAGVFSEPHPFRPYLGRDEWARDRYLSLSGITGVTIGGLPRYGKTSLTSSLLYQLAGTPKVQFVILDGKGGVDYEDWADRALRLSGDDLDEALEVLEWLTDLMQDRQRRIRHVLGVKNGWHVGPSEDFPLIVIIFDECQTFFDPNQAGNDSKLKAKYLKAQSMAAQLVKKSGSVMMLSIFITQKQTGDAIPTAIRDNCTVGLSFAVKTRDAAVAALGDAIRDWPSLCPTTLKERPTYVGVCTAALPDGEEDFVRLRVPEIPEAIASRRAAETAHLRRGVSLSPVRSVLDADAA